MSDAYIQLQIPDGPVQPVWYPTANALFDDAREDFSAGVLKWDQSEGYVARLFGPSWIPDFGTPTTLGSIPPSVWVSEPVALQNVARLDGYCRALGVRFPAVSGDVQIAGCAIYLPSGRVVWAGTDFVGNVPQLNQDVYVVWSENYAGPFRL